MSVAATTPWIPYATRAAATHHVVSRRCGGIPPLLFLAQAGLAVPSSIEGIVDFGGRETVAAVRVGWGF